MRICINGVCSETRLLMVTIANGSRYGGGFMVAPGAKIDDGKFNIVLIGPIFSLSRFFYLPKIEKGKHLSLSFVKNTNGEIIQVTTSRAIAAHLDGELMMGNSFYCRMMAAKFLFLY